VSTLTAIVNRRLLRLNPLLEKGLYVLSTFATPLALVLFSLIAMLAWETQYPVSEPKALNFKVLQGSSELTDPMVVSQRLVEQALTPYRETHLSEDAFWLAIAVPAAGSLEPHSLEFPSRHITDMTCWEGRAPGALGAASRHAGAGGLASVKAGFALDLKPTKEATNVLCRIRSVGPARLSVKLWTTADLNVNNREFHRKSGLLDGGIIVLALFVLVTAMVNRSGLYLLFAAWLVVNLRMGALSVGWDTQWLGNEVPQEWVQRMRLMTTSVYYLLTASLFSTLFHDDLKALKSRKLLRLGQWTCIPLLILSAVLSYREYLPLLWISTGLCIFILIYYLAQILIKSRSRVAIWYSAGIAVTLIASFSEIISAALGARGLIGSVNSVTAALSSSLLTALAIAQQMRQEHEQRLAVQAELEHTFEAMPIGLFTLDMEGRFLSANPALISMLGRRVLTDGSNSWHQYFEAGAWTQLHQMVHAQRVAEQETAAPATTPGFGPSVLPEALGAVATELEIKGRSASGQLGAKRFLVKATLARDKIEGSLQDVTEKSKATEDLYFLANHDSLTKVLNRRGIERVLNGAIHQLSGGRAMGLAYLDLDRFKLINDLFGHGVGDEVLQQVCKRVTDMLPTDIRFGRVGGDEFVIVFRDTPIAMATHMCQGIVDSIGTRPYRVGGKAFYVRGSIGLIEVGADMAFKDAISTADRACRQAKTANSGGLVVYEKYAVAFQQHEAELKLISQLSTSSATVGLYLEMQPIMSLTAPHESLNFEVLLRMKDSEGKVVPTERLIAAGEASGRMAVIDRWVLVSTLAWLDQHQERLKHTRFVCMNLSGASLNDEKFQQDVYELLDKNRHIVGQLCLEITESVALHDLDNTRTFVNKVRRIGARVALDDFGAGYTSFSYLKEISADLLKIDGSFIVNMNQHPANIAIVEAIVNLAKNLGMKVIAEWAEDNATVQTLIDIGVDYVQGFVVSRSQHPDKILLATSSAGFIKDDELTLMMSQIGKAEPGLNQVDLFSDVAGSRLH
jgi:diguanylate cyclase (GGDEF)-like protein